MNLECIQCLWNIENNIHVPRVPFHTTISQIRQQRRWACSLWFCTTHSMDGHATLYTKHQPHTNTLSTAKHQVSRYRNQARQHKEKKQASEWAERPHHTDNGRVGWDHQIHTSQLPRMIRNHMYTRFYQAPCQLCLTTSISATDDITHQRPCFFTRVQQRRTSMSFTFHFTQNIPVRQQWGWAYNLRRFCTGMESSASWLWELVWCFSVAETITNHTPPESCAVWWPCTKNCALQRKTGHFTRRWVHLMELWCLLWLCPHQIKIRPGYWVGNLGTFHASSNQKQLLDKAINIAGIGMGDVEKNLEPVLNARLEEMSVIYGKCINRFCKILDSEGVKYTEYDTSGSLVQIMAGGRGISATECAPNREGLLCGQCKNGYSLTMYYTVGFKIVYCWKTRSRDGLTKQLHWVETMLSTCW